MKDGIRCPYCNCAMSRVRNTIPIKNRSGIVTRIRRYRVCGNRNCGLSFATLESIVETEEPATSPQRDFRDPNLPHNPYIS